MQQNRIKSLHHNGNFLKWNRRRSNIPVVSTNRQLPNSLKNWRIAVIGPLRALINAIYFVKINEKGSLNSHMHAKIFVSEI